MSKTMREVKERLYAKYGQRCEVCGKKFEKKKLTGHHIIMKSCKGPITETNILIACQDCHFKVINKITYNSKQYWDLMNKCLAHRTSEPT